MTKGRAKKIGTIIVPPGVFISVHEKLAPDYLATALNYDITFLIPDRRKGKKTPDIQMQKLLWEIKSPNGKSSRTIENNLRSALLQSPNIVLDLRHIDGRIPTTKLLNETERQFNLTKSIKNLLVITRQHEHVVFKR